MDELVAHPVRPIVDAVYIVRNGRQAALRIAESHVSKRIVPRQYTTQTRGIGDGLGHPKAIVSNGLFDRADAAPVAVGDGRSLVDGRRPFRAASRRIAIFVCLQN